MKGRLLPALLLALSIPVAAKQPLTIEDIVNLKTVTDPQISPDGDWVLYVVTYPQHGSDIWLISGDGGTARQFTSHPGPDLHPRWAPDGKTIAFLSTRPDEKAKAQIHLIPADGGESKALTDESESVDAFAWSPDGSSIAYTVIQEEDEELKNRKEKQEDHVVADQPRQRRLKIIPATGGQPKTVSPENRSVFNFAWSPDGKTVAAYTASDPGANQGYWNARLVVIDLENNRVTTLLKSTRSTPLVFSPNGKQIATLGPEGDRFTWPTPAIVPVTGGRAFLPCPDHQGTIRDIAWSPDGKSLILYGHESTEGFLGEVSSRGGKVKHWFKTTLRAWSGPAMSLSRSGRWMAYLADHPTHPTEVFIASRTTRPLQGRRLTITNPDVESRLLGKVESIQWKVQDGLVIHGIIIHPAGQPDARSAPTIVMIHGGPQWQWWRGWLGTWHEPAQLLAANGYRVLLPNPRGSSGRGVEFASSAYGDWGGKDLEDILAGIDAQVGKGLTDPDRLGVIGWSYGGYMTSWAIAQTKRFKAAVAGAAVTNLLSMQGTCDIPLFLPDQFGSSPYREPHIFLERSPVYFAQQVTTPILVVHGESDVRVPVTQGRELYQALKEAGVECSFITFPREGHSFKEPGHQRILLVETLHWLDRHITGKSGDGG